MGIPEHTSGYSLKKLVVSLVLIAIGVFVMAVLITLGADALCVRDSTRWLPPYPGSEIVEERFTFLRMWGVGQTTQVLYTADNINTVRQWYFEQDTENSRGGNARGGLATVNWQLSEPEDREGTVITLQSSCAHELDLSPFGISRAG